MPLPQFQRPVNRAVVSPQDTSAIQKPKGCSSCSARMRNESRNNVNAAPQVVNPNVNRWRAQK